MALTWDITNIKNANKVCWDKKGKMNAITEAIIFGTMTIGIRQITEANAEDFFQRIWLAERVFGPVVYQMEDDGNGREQKVDLPISYADVRAHIGLSTNAGLKTWPQFCQILRDESGRVAKTSLPKAA